MEMNGKKFVGVLLWAGHTGNGNGKWIRMILNEDGLRVDAFAGETDSTDSYRRVDTLYPGLNFHVQLAITGKQYQEYQPLIKHRESEFHKFAKTNKREMTPEEYHKYFNTMF